MSRIKATTRNEVFRRFKYQCQVPGCKKKHSPRDPLTVHHLDHNPDNNGLRNLTVVHNSCNIAIRNRHQAGIKKFLKIFGQPKRNQRTFASFLEV